MNVVKCEILQVYNIFESIYSAEVKVVEGDFPNEVGLSMSSNPLPSIVSYHVISHQERLFRLFYQSCKESPFINLTFNNDKQLSITKPFKRLLLCIDDSSIIESLALIRYLTTKFFDCYVYFMTDMNFADNKSLYFQDILGERFSKITFSQDNMNQILQSQEIGTRLFLLGKWSMVEELKKMAISIGFTDEEMDIYGVGEKIDYIFCAKCYQFSMKPNPLHGETTCSHCQTSLDVSSHFSKRLNAYLGYIHV